MGIEPNGARKMRRKLERRADGTLVARPMPLGPVELGPTVTITEAARRAGVSRRTMARWIAAGVVETVEIGLAAADGPDAADGRTRVRVSESGAPLARSGRAILNGGGAA